jgi:AbrB family looped-hinge helix DNA binding protein
VAKVTSKLQVTIPKALADEYGIKPGIELEWQAAGDIIHVVPPQAASPTRDRRERLRLFDQATARQRAREKGRTLPPAKNRGWTREDLYDRGRAR